MKGVRGAYQYEAVVNMLIGNRKRHKYLHH